MMTQVEEAIPRPDIIKMLGWCDRKFWKRRPELIKYGVIFYRYSGKPPKKRIYAFPSRIHKYIAIKLKLERCYKEQNL